MTDTRQVNNKHQPRFLTGLMIGWLAGTAAMLLFAPQSGKQTRDLIEEKGIALRDLTDANIKKAFARVRAGTKRITADVQEKAGELKQAGQDTLVRQMDRMSAALDAGKSAVESA